MGTSKKSLTRAREVDGVLADQEKGGRAGAKKKDQDRGEKTGTLRKLSGKEVRGGEGLWRRQPYQAVEGVPER